MPFDAGAWLTAPRINALSNEQKGVWVTLLCLMWESPKRGVVMGRDGECHTKRGLCKLIDCMATDIDALVECGLLQQSENGTYSCHDMIRAEEIRNARRAAGSKGGRQSTKQRITPIHQVNADEPTEKPQDAHVETHGEPAIMEQPATQAPQAIQPPLPIVEQPQEETPPPTQDEPPEIPDISEATDPPPELTPAEKAKAERQRKYKYADNVTLTRIEFAKLVETHGEPAAKWMIAKLDAYKGQNGRRYKSDYKAILNWVVGALQEEILKHGNNGLINTTFAPKPAGGTGDIAGDATGAVPTATGASAQSGDAPPKDYSERF